MKIQLIEGRRIIPGRAVKYFSDDLDSSVSESKESKWHALRKGQVVDIDEQAIAREFDAENFLQLQHKDARFRCFKIVKERATLSINKAKKDGEN